MGGTIITVPEKDGRIRTCGDYQVRLTLYWKLTNILFLVLLICSLHWLEENVFPIKTYVIHIANQNSVGSRFTQIPKQQYSSSIVSLYPSTFRSVLAPVIFQKTMDIILQGMDNVMCYIDDIIIMG